MFKTFLFLLFINCSDLKLIQFNRIYLEVDIVTDIISQFFGYNTIFHFDNKTKEDVDKIIIETFNNGSYFTINYDLKDNSSVILLRPPGYKFLHIVLLEIYNRFDRYMNADEFNLEHQDVVLFVINNHLNERTKDLNNKSNEVNFHYNIKRYELWEPNRLNRSGTVFVLDSWDLSLYTICFFCGNLSKVLQKIDGFNITNEYNITLPNLLKRTNKFRDFNNHTFSVAFVEYRPYFWHENHNGIGKEIFGSEGELLNVLSKKLQFKLKLNDYSGMADAWKEMVNSVRYRKVDWAVGGITVSIDRIKVADFTNFIRPEPYTALYSVYKDIWMSWENILMPFQLNLWILLTGTTLIISILLYLTIKYTHVNKSQSFLYYMQGCWRFLVEQPFADVPPIFRTRYTTIILMILWWSTALILTNVYKSKLTSSLIDTRAFEPNSIDGLVQYGFKFQVNKEDASVLIENLRTSNDPVFLEVLKRSKNDTAFCPSIWKTVNRRIAVIDEETTLNYEVITNCRKSMSISEQEGLRLIRDQLFPSTQAWPVQLAAPYRQSFSSIISRLHASGLFLKWQTESMSGVVIPKSHQGSSSTNEVKFDLVTILGPALIWLLGISIAVIIFICEKLYYQRKMKKITNKNKIIKKFKDYYIGNKHT